MKSLGIILILLVCSCINQDKKNDDNKNSDILNRSNEKDMSSTSDNLTIEENSSPDFSRMRNDYVRNYKNVIVYDTTFFDSSDSIMAKVKYYCSFDSSIVIPAKYIFDGELEKFVTHNFLSENLALFNKDTVFNSQVNKETFKSLLSDELIDYGVLLSPSPIRYDSIEKKIIFHYSVSIPITDIGTSATLMVDSLGTTEIVQYYR